MKADFYADIEILESGYIYLNSIKDEEDIINSYQNHVGFVKKMGTRTECLEGFKKKYIYLNVKFDGRKGVKNEDVMAELVRKELALDTGAKSIFGNFYKPTENLLKLLAEQLKQRKQLTGVA
ncbi:hypothetical protein [Bacillus subtilis]|uniref:hypothetical protein n=1 Tax=Bacillus subtilis TaxID=1423 RepID=UPI000DC57A7E|nr:hypothetical protein [Bacillus subtilis]MDI6587225.1 hypothetical protein [Bacillus subtilis]MDM5457969.1 hypothetical protein [Bacillus subtilis]QGI05139.1 hypothetical protein GII78_11340 [Bacillus subtilis]RAP10681.1 hypothetical protein HS3_01100 [Bacillus subtilis]